MNILSLPWLELALGLPLLGAVVGYRRDAETARAWRLLFSLLTWVCALLAWLGFYLGATGSTHGTLQQACFGRIVFAVDELSAPFIPLIAFVHLLTCLATTRNKAQRFSFGLAMLAESLRMGIFCCMDPWLLIGLLVLKCVPGGVDLALRRQSVRLYGLHMLLFVGLLVGGWWYVEQAENVAAIPPGAVVCVLAAMLIRCGTFPFHTWVTELFQRGSFGNALLFLTPLTGVYAIVRLVLPIAPDWVLHSLGGISLFTALYAAALATIQREARRFFAYVFISHSSVVLLGLELATHVSLTGSLALWFGSILSLGGFGLALRAIEARVGRLTLTEYRGYYDQSPLLALIFLFTGLASVGFPGTISFISAELLVDGAVHANLPLGLGVVLAAALNGIAVLRVYLLIFTGARYTTTISLAITPRERFVLLAFAVLILGGGLYPQPGIQTRHQAAVAIGKVRTERHITEEPSTFDDEE